MHRRIPPCRVGEIWVSGPNVTRGYWRNQAATAETFHARIADEPGRTWLRTGDLGFLDENGGLFITGRIKDLIIIRGMNHYPQDIERTVQDSHPALRRDCGAAFAITDEDGNERLAVVQEVERTHRRNLDFDEVAGRIREAVTRQHEIAIHTIALIPPATLAEDHQRQDPARSCEKTVARRCAGESLAEARQPVRGRRRTSGRT